MNVYSIYPIMRTFRLTTLISSIAIFLLLASSCNEKQSESTLGSTILDTMSNDKLLKGSNRAFQEDEEQKVTFTVIHNGDLAKMTSGVNTNFKALIDSYGLTIESSFEIDKENKGVVLVSSATTTLVSPIDVGKEFSMLEEVLMVEVGGAKNTTRGVS